MDVVVSAAPANARIVAGDPNRFAGPGSGRFGASMFLAPSMMAEGDKDQDGKLSENEFADLAEKWFAAWDKEKAGTLTADQLAAGLGTVVGPRPGGPPPGPRGGGFNLQGPPGKRNGLASMMGIEFTYVHADLEFEGQQFKNVAVRYKGNGTFMESRGSEKRPLKIDLNEFEDGHKLADQAQLNLHNNVTDPSWMNEVLAHRLFRDAGVPAPRTAFARRVRHRARQVRPRVLRSVFTCGGRRQTVRRVELRQASKSRCSSRSRLACLPIWATTGALTLKRTTQRPRSPRPSSSD